MTDKPRVRVTLTMLDKPLRSAITKHDLDDLIASNEGLREDEARIRTEIAADRTYHGGGGRGGWPPFEMRAVTAPHA